MTETNASSPQRLRAAGAGRRRGFDADDVLVRVVDIFWQHGFATTTVRQLEAELGLTASSIYNTYGSKNELLDAAIEQYLTLMDRHVLAELRGAPDPLTGLQEFFHRVAIGVDGEHRWGCFVVSLLTENAGRDDTINQHTAQYFDTLRSDFTAALRQADAADLLDPSLVGTDRDGWIDAQVDLLLANVLGINTAARGRMGDAVVESMMRSVQSQIEQWRATS